MTRIFLILSLIFTSACSNPNWYKPMGYLFNNMPKGGTPGFNLGWTHGCQSGLGSDFGGNYYMTWYTWSRDPDITSSNPDFEKIKKRYKKELKDIDWNNETEVKKSFSDYNTIFWAAHSYCRHSVVGMLQTAGLTPNIANERRWEPEKHSIGAVWKLTGKGDVRIGASGLW